MSKTISKGAYPPATLQMNAMGHLHVWPGTVSPQKTGKYNYQVEGQDSPIYIQVRNDIDQILESLTPDEREELERGYTVHTTNFPDDYFALAKMTKANKPKQFSLDELQAMPTIEAGYTDDLKYDDGHWRVWLSRLTREDGMPYDHAVTVEQNKDGKWVEVETYRAKTAAAATLAKASQIDFAGPLVEALEKQAEEKVESDPQLSAALKSLANIVSANAESQAEDLATAIIDFLGKEPDSVLVGAVGQVVNLLKSMSDSESAQAVAAHIESVIAAVNKLQKQDEEEEGDPNDPSDPRPGNPGFNLEEWVANVLGVSGQDEEIGNAQYEGYYALILADLGEEGRGFIYSVDSAGFTNIDVYDSESAAREAWSDLLRNLDDITAQAVQDQRKEIAETMRSYLKEYPGASVEALVLHAIDMWEGYAGGEMAEAAMSRIARDVLHGNSSQKRAFAKNGARKLNLSDGQRLRKTISFGHVVANSGLEKYRKRTSMSAHRIVRNATSSRRDRKSLNKSTIDPERVMDGYIRAALFAGQDEEGIPLSRNFTRSDLSSQLLRGLERDVRTFLDQARDHLAKTPNPDSNDVGIELFYTRNRHGVGFWDKPEKWGGEKNAEALTDIAHGLGEDEWYVGDDGEIYSTAAMSKMNSRRAFLKADDEQGEMTPLEGWDLDEDEFSRSFELGNDYYHGRIFRDKWGGWQAVIEQPQGADIKLGDYHTKEQAAKVIVDYIDNELSEALEEAGIEIRVKPHEIEAWIDKAVETMTEADDDVERAAYDLAVQAQEALGFSGNAMRMAIDYAKSRLLDAFDYDDYEALAKPQTTKGESSGSEEHKRVIEKLQDEVDNLKEQLNNLRKTPRPGGPILRQLSLSAVNKVLPTESNPEIPHKGGDDLESRVVELQRLAALEPNPLLKAQYQKELNDIESRLLK